MAIVQTNKTQRGFTLLEALIALVILSVGMLGIAALYVEGLRAGRTAVFRTTAVTLAADMMDRIRTNPAAQDDYTLAGAMSDCTNGGVDCDRTQVAREDVAIWEAEVAARLPAGADSNITFAAGAPEDTYTITISWPEPGFDEDLAYTLTARM
ncbi:MAG: type IV pilus modification protein PilV [Gammaproteobacteria bacterium]|nr:type IV pilus modification protein PilV [Gammaproteobacteria bacterium]MDP6617037.1 type IV pilus modification protein PilV [Gammaproteobacteria bacterium]MDP6695071.1 type IV pilus modification protein PilV [Gammaproteobacteria bacterium]